MDPLASFLNLTHILQHLSQHLPRLLCPGSCRNSMPVYLLKINSGVAEDYTYRLVSKYLLSIYLLVY